MVALETLRRGLRFETLDLLPTLSGRSRPHPRANAWNAPCGVASHEARSSSS